MKLLLLPMLLLPFQSTAKGSESRVEFDCLLQNEMTYEIRNWELERSDVNTFVDKIDALTKLTFGFADSGRIRINLGTYSGHGWANGFAIATERHKPQTSYNKHNRVPAGFSLVTNDHEINSALPKLSMSYIYIELKDGDRYLNIVHKNGVASGVSFSQRGGEKSLRTFKCKAPNNGWNDVIDRLKNSLL